MNNMKIHALTKAKEDLNDFVGSWNGEDSQFMHEGSTYSEDDVSCAEEAIEKIDELEELLNELAI